MVRVVLAVAAAASILPAVAAQAMCYFPDGTASPTDFVCNSTTGDGFSSCCGHQADNTAAYCMSNGLCLSDMFLSRGSCTDKSWKSSNCAQVCTTTNPGGGIGVRPCGYTGNWDCGNGSTCDSAAVKINTGNFILTNAQLNAMDAERIPASSTSASPSTAATTSASSGTASAATATSTPSGLVQASQVTAVGAGVGVPLGILAASFLALWLFERRKSAQLKKQIALENQKFHPSAPGSAYHPSISGPTAAGINRMPSQHSAILSPTSNYGQQQPPMPMHPAMMQQQIAQHPGMQRMASQSSIHGVHPAYQNMGPGTPPPPPPPPKAFHHAWTAEAPGDQGRVAPPGLSHVQELDTNR